MHTRQEAQYALSIPTYTQNGLSRNEFQKPFLPTHENMRNLHLHKGQERHLRGAIARGSVCIEGTIAKWMYWWLHKHHQIAVNGLFRTWPGTWTETIDRLRNPRIKLH
ncbi:MAG: NAD(P)/FAD-dependent oxidoreductase [Noviherbaspirillum sp.]|nr:NAD(P)/FAD-dependent oxidoreductase [Noviherbaspirillum sp.]